jgi:hypothetical protein
LREPSSGAKCFAFLPRRWIAAGYAGTSSSSTRVGTRDRSIDEFVSPLIALGIGGAICSGRKLGMSEFGPARAGAGGVDLSGASLRSWPLRQLRARAKPSLSLVGDSLRNEHRTLRFPPPHVPNWPAGNQRGYVGSLIAEVIELENHDVHLAAVEADMR